ncbi:hypothetical protein ANN_15687 [Periplaneta americana]|uniref:Uncharacterized protein n=1 Tax=Periplaneta americana TaxID=6978 RepID=A0ABQ8SHA6_PERAM|nr:hypothetical protein ANN_15687 [Periplaneta americana]
MVGLCEGGNEPPGSLKHIQETLELSVLLLRATEGLNEDGRESITVRFTRGYVRDLTDGRAGLTPNLDLFACDPPVKQSSNSIKTGADLLPYISIGSFVSCDSLFNQMEAFTSAERTYQKLRVSLRRSLLHVPQPSSNTHNGNAHFGPTCAVTITPPQGHDVIYTPCTLNLMLVTLCP